VVFFLQPFKFRGRSCRGTPEPHPWLSGPARRPGIRFCWRRAGPAFSVGAPVVGRAWAGPSRLGPCSRSGPGGFRGFGRWTWPSGAAAGRPGFGMLGSARPVPTLPGHSLSAVPVCVVTAAAPLREPLDRGGWTGNASTPSGAARWEPHGAALHLLRWPSFAPSSVLARNWSGLSASSPAGAAKRD
jgi:hypothetical protein